MRLVDADALRDIAIRHRPSALVSTDFAEGMKQAVDYLVTDIDAAPTIECAACERAHNEDCPDDIYRKHIRGWECMADFGCSNFQRRQP